MLGILIILIVLIVACNASYASSEYGSTCEKASVIASWLLTFLFIALSFAYFDYLQSNPDQHIKDYLNGKIVPQTTIIDQDTTIMYIYKK